MERKTLLKRILIGLLALLAAGVLLIGGIVLWDTIFPAQQATDFTNVSYTGPDGTTLHAYLAEPVGGTTPGPAVLMVHEFFGLNAGIIEKADRLAEQGYTVLAADGYRGQSTKLVPRAIWLVVTTPRERVQADLQAGFDYLAGLAQVDPEKVASVGFCFGGTQVMHLATTNADLAGTVIFYGSGPISDPQQLGVMDQGGPVLGIYGENDTSIPLDEVEAFRQAMEARGVAHEISIYPGVGHAFVTAENLDEPGPAGEAWQEMLAFLDINLGLER
jgi:carboxymethylenebutenolidase